MGALLCMTMRIALLLLTLSLVACGGDASSSMAPSPVPQPTPAPAPPPTPFQGVWTGIWTKQQCSETGAAIGVGCGFIPASGGLNITLVQSAAAAQGTVSVGLFQMNVSGPISPAQELTLTGQARQSSTTINLNSWRTSLNNTVMIGAFTFTLVPDDTQLGTVTITAGLQGVVKQ